MSYCTTILNPIARHYTRSMSYTDQREASPHMDLTTRIEEGLRSELLSRMPADPTGELNGLPLANLLSCWFVARHVG
jgi:hypothetical protein